MDLLRYTYMDPLHTCPARSEDSLHLQGIHSQDFRKQEEQLSMFTANVLFRCILAFRIHPLRKQHLTRVCGFTEAAVRAFSFCRAVSAFVSSPVGGQGQWHSAALQTFVRPR